MNNCQVSVYLAYFMAAYCIASIYYFISSKCMGTPFNDSLTEIQKTIKKESSKTRGNLFLQGMILGAVILFIKKPFRLC
jgi:hypothetical protein